MFLDTDIDIEKEKEKEKDKQIPYLLITLSIIFALLGWFLANGNSKTQYVRLLDVFIYGPYLTYLAFQTNYTFTIVEKIFLLFLEGLISTGFATDQRINWT